MDPNVLTIVVGVAGIAASFLFYWAGKRSSGKENRQLRQDIKDLGEVLATLASKGDVRRMLALTGSDEARGAAPTERPSGTGSPVEVLVRATLGALVNERGEVSVPRLMRQVGLAAGSSSLSEVVEVLRRLRTEGAVDWDGDAASPSAAGTVRVRARSGGSA